MWRDALFLEQHLRLRAFLIRHRPAGASVGDGLPDQLGHVDDQIGPGLGGIAGSADLAGADADHIVQPTIGLAIGQVKH